MLCNPYGMPSLCLIPSCLNVNKRRLGLSFFRVDRIVYTGFLRSTFTFHFRFMMCGMGVIFKMMFFNCLLFFLGSIFVEGKETFF